MNDQVSNPTNDYCSLVLIAFILFPLIGFFFGIGVNYVLFVLGNNPRWERIPAPPSPAIELVAAAPGCVYIESIDENSYYFCDNFYAEQGHWRRFDHIEETGAEMPCPETFLDFPDDAVQLIEFCLGKEYIEYNQFALFKDGSVKMRRNQGDPMGSFYRGILLGLGSGALGLFSGVGYYFFRKSKSKMNSDI